MVKVVRLLILLVWDQGGRPKVRKLAIRVNVDLASLTWAPPGFLNFGLDYRLMLVTLLVLILLLGLTVFVFLVRFTSFLGTLHWPSGSVDLGHFGISFLELLNPFRAMGWTPIA